MTTIRESIIAAITAALVGTIGVDSRIFRSRVTALSRAEHPALIIEPVQDQADQQVIGYAQWALNLRIGVFVKGDIPDQVADPIIESLHSKIMADQSLGGLCQDIQPVGVIYQFEDADQPSGFASCEYRIIYRTKLTDLTASI